MATAETERFKWPVPGWDADWQEWQDTFLDMANNIDAVVFGSMSNNKLVMKQLPTVASTFSGGNWSMTMYSDAVFVDRTLMVQIRLAAETVQLEADSILAVTLTPGAVGTQNTSWEVYTQGVAIAPEVVPLGYVDDSFNITWYNGAVLLAGEARRLFEFPSGISERIGEVINIVDCTAAPPTEITGDRYILDDTAGVVHPNWDGAGKLDIVEFNGATWDSQTPQIGWIAFVTVLGTDAHYMENPIPAWELGPKIGGFTQGSVLFANPTGDITEDNANFFWDDTNNRLGIGTVVPSAPFHVESSITSGNIAYIKSTPGSASTANVLTLEADGSNWGSGARVLEIISDDNDAIPLVVNDGSSNVLTMTRSGSVTMDGDLYLNSGGNIYSTANGNITMSPNGTGVLVGSSDFDLNGDLLQKIVNLNSATYTVLAGDETIFVDYTATGICTITIPSALIAKDGWTIVIKDSGLNATVNKIVVETEGAELIEGSSNLEINVSGVAFTLRSDGTDLFII